jgi:protein SCO1/2
VNPARQVPEVGFTENTKEYLSKDIRLINKNDSLVALGDLIDRPTVLNFVYYDCPGICTPLMNELARLVDKMDLVLGKDYQILTVSFDPQETTRLAQQKRRNIISTLQKKNQAEEGWKFFTADSAQIRKLTQEAGFHYQPQGQDYIHSAGFLAVSPEGKITRYLKGVSFLPFELKMSMIEASKGEVGPPINKVLQYCFAYDPEGQTYVADITKISGIVIIFLALVLFTVLIIRSNRKKSNAKVQTQ